jgi:tripartite-type tricarboxylate transporter receptor subunit TctC
MTFHSVAQQRTRWGCLMKPNIALVAVAAGMFAAAGCASTDVEGGEYPDRDITLVVPFPAGSFTDLAARAEAACLEETLSTSVVVQNVDGGGGTVGMTEVATADADGYKVGVASTSTALVAPFFTAGLDYSLDSFKFTGSIVVTPFLMVVEADSQYNTLDDLVAASQQLTVASSGESTTSGVVTLALTQYHGFPAEQVPMGSLGEAKRGLQQGDYDAAVVALSPEIVKSVQDGELKALGVVSDERLEALPDVPTFNQEGYGEGQLAGPGTLAMLALPVDTPDDVVEELDAAVMECSTDPDYEAALGETGQYISPEEVSAALEAGETSLEALEVN